MSVPLVPLDTQYLTKKLMKYKWIKVKYLFVINKSMFPKMSKQISLVNCSKITIIAIEV